MLYRTDRNFVLTSYRIRHPFDNRKDHFAGLGALTPVPNRRPARVVCNSPIPHGSKRMRILRSISLHLAKIKYLLRTNIHLECLFHPPYQSGGQVDAKDNHMMYLIRPLVSKEKTQPFSWTKWVFKRRLQLISRAGSSPGA